MARPSPTAERGMPLRDRPTPRRTWVPRLLLLGLAAMSLADVLVVKEAAVLSQQDLSTRLAAALDLPADERRARLTRLREGAIGLPPRKWLDAILHELDGLRCSTTAPRPSTDQLKLTGE